MESTESSYIGGNLDHPTYEAVCGGQTGHAETVRIIFDSRLITYKELLEISFAVHDPTTPNRRGNDKGTQYRSAIFFYDPTHRHTAETLIKTLTEEKLYGAPIVTHVVPAGQWYEAEPIIRNILFEIPSKVTVSLWWVQKSPSLESSLLIA